MDDDLIRFGESYDPEMRALQRRLQRAEVDRDHYKALASGKVRTSGGASGWGEKFGKRVFDLVKSYVERKSNDIQEKLLARMADTDGQVDELLGRIETLEAELKELRAAGVSAP